MTLFDIIPPPVGVRVLFILGVVNLVFGLLVFFSCRCMPGLRLGARLMKYDSYQRFYRLHCYFWPVFWTSVMVHAIFGILFVGVPF